MPGNIFPFHLNQTLNWKVRNFPDNVYNFNPTDYLTTLMSVLLGNTGVGQLSTVQTSSRLNQQFMEFSDLDNIMGMLLNTPRLPSEIYTLNVNPFTDQITTSGWTDIISKDASYRSRLDSTAAAYTRGATSFGLQRTAEAASGLKFRVIEVWNTTLNGTTISGTNIQTRGFGNNEVVFQPLVLPDIGFDNNSKSAVVQSLKNLKTVGSNFTIASGISNFVQLPYSSTGIGTATTSGNYTVLSSGVSEYFHMERTVTGNQINIPTYVNNTNDQTILSRYWLRNNQTTQAPYFAHLQTQETEINVTQNISAVNVSITTTANGYTPPPVVSTTNILSNPILKVTSTVYGSS